MPGAGVAGALTADNELGCATVSSLVGGPADEAPVI